MARTTWLIVFGVACYGFGALSVTADELYGIAQFYGPNATYFFPIIGGRGLWDAWVYVFSGLGICFFLAALSLQMLQKTWTPKNKQALPIIERIEIRDAPSARAVDSQ